MKISKGKQYKYADKVKELKVDVLPKEQASALSFTTKEYLADNKHSADKRSDFFKITHQQVIKSISERNSKEITANGEHTQTNVSEKHSIEYTDKTAVDSLKPKTTKGSKQKTVYNKNQISKTAANLGIKAEVKNQLGNMVTQADYSSKKAIKGGSTAALKIIRSDIEETADNDLAFKAVDDVIKTAEAAAATKKGVTAAVNTGISIAKTGTHTIKAVRKAPENISAVNKQFKERIRKIQKVRRMKKSTQTKLLKQGGKKAVDNTIKTIAYTAKGFVIKFTAMFLALIILIIAICGAVVAAIGSFLWQTSSDLDTTQIIKYISELDYNQQNAWLSKGKTNVEIERQNENLEKSYDYHYLLAVDVPDDTQPLDNFDEGEAHCMVREGFSPNGRELMPTYRGFNKEFSSSDEMLETYRFTTDDYRDALAYIQVKNENLGWFATVFGFVGEYQLKNSAKELHELTYKHNIVLKKVGSDEEVDYSYQEPIYSISYANDDSYNYYYFGRKYSVKYLIDNDMVRFDADDAKNNLMKEQYEYIYKYGNFAVGNLSFPLELGDDEKIADRIVKHFGKQAALEYHPPEPDEDKTVYGTVSKSAAYHYANDLSANAGDIIYAPINGLCKAKQRDNRGYEYTICTSYNGNDFDLTKAGYLVKISCSSASYISSAAPKVVKKGDWLGLVADNIEVNYKTPETANDTENEDIFADKLFPCSTLTDYHSIGGDEFAIPEPTGNHIHIEMYKLPCDFTNKADIEKNVLAPELFFDYSKETD